MVVQYSIGKADIAKIKEAVKVHNKTSSEKSAKYANIKVSCYVGNRESY